MVPKSIAAMLPDGTRKPDFFLGTRFATSQPLDVFRTSPTLAIYAIIFDLQYPMYNLLSEAFCSVSTSCLCKLHNRSEVYS